jgi:hypothetical protein
MLMRRNSLQALVQSMRHRQERVLHNLWNRTVSPDSGQIQCGPVAARVVELAVPSRTSADLSHDRGRSRAAAPEH